VHPLLLVVGAVGVVLLGREAWLYASAHPFAVGAGATAAVAVAGGATWTVLHRRGRLRRGIAGTDRMTGAQFEHYVADLMRRTGFRAVRVTGRAADLGADIVATSADGRRVVVQCKRFAGSVGSPHVQRLNGTAWTIHGAEITMLVTTGRITSNARELAGRCGIMLVDRDALAAWVSSGDPGRLLAPRR
jgi:restriction system protein